MSQINQLFCTVCNPEAEDFAGIRKVVGVTSQELTSLIKHFIENHISVTDNETESPAIDTEARDAASEVREIAEEALRTAQKAIDAVNLLQEENNSNGAGFYEDAGATAVPEATQTGTISIPEGETQG